MEQTKKSQKEQKGKNQGEQSSKKQGEQGSKDHREQSSKNKGKRSGKPVGEQNSSDKGEQISKIVEEKSSKEKREEKSSDREKNGGSDKGKQNNKGVESQGKLSTRIQDDKIQGAHGMSKRLGAGASTNLLEESLNRELSRLDTGASGSSYRDPPAKGCHSPKDLIDQSRDSYFGQSSVDPVPDPFDWIKDSCEQRDPTS